MADAGDLRRLFGALKSAGSPLQRVKLLARAWRTLRTLSPKQRRHLASTVGIDGAEEILEQLADRGSRVTPAFLLQTLEKIKSTDPDQLQKTVNGLRDPDRRGELIQRGLDRLTGAAAASVAAVSRSTPTAGQSSETRSAAPEQTAVERPPEIVPEVAAAPVTAPQVRSQAPPPPQPRAEPEPEPKPMPEPEPAPVIPSTDASVPSLDERLEEITGLTARFRTLRTHAEQARDLSTDELRGLIDRFPSGWARRRALCALLEARIPGDLHQAIFLVESLDSPMDRRWCIAAILRSFELSEFEAQALLERHGSFVRRRVADSSVVLS